MTSSQISSAAGTAAVDAVLAQPEHTLLVVDFDGTLSPIVDNPDAALADQDAVEAFARLGSLLGQVAVLTGRPAETAVRMGGFAGVAGLESLVVLGQYGVERWNAADGQLITPPEPPEIKAMTDELGGVLADLGLSDARIEHKGRAVGVHTRQLGDPAEAFARLADPLGDLAARHGLLLEPGKHVLEIRAPGIDKGVALNDLIDETGLEHVIFIGDDLGDLPAFRAVQQRRERSLHGLLVCSASQEEDALTDLADVVVDGPSGVADWLNALADSIEGRAALVSAETSP